MSNFFPTAAYCISGNQDSALHHKPQGESLKHVGIMQVLTTMLITAGFGVGCNKIQVSEVDPSNFGIFGAPEPPDTGFVRDTCANAVQKSVTKSFNFAKPSMTCEWEKNENLERRNEYFQARIEDEKELQLEPGAVICDVRLSFKEQEFLYDDHFLLTFNNSVIASSYNFSDELESSYGLLQYNWSRIAGMYWDQDHKEGVFCAPSGECSWPDTDTPGEINMSYSSELFKRLMAVDLGRTSHYLKFISIGDNDDEDCEHSDVAFDLTVKYVVVK